MFGTKDCGFTVKTSPDLLFWGWIAIWGVGELGGFPLVDCGLACEPYGEDCPSPSDILGKMLTLLSFFKIEETDWPSLNGILGKILTNLSFFTTDGTCLGFSLGMGTLRIISPLVLTESSILAICGVIVKSCLLDTSALTAVSKNDIGIPASGKFTNFSPVLSMSEDCEINTDIVGLSHGTIRS